MKNDRAVDGDENGMDFTVVILPFIPESSAMRGSTEDTSVHLRLNKGSEKTSMCARNTPAHTYRAGEDLPMFEALYASRINCTQ